MGQRISVLEVQETSCPTGRFALLPVSATPEELCRSQSCFTALRGYISLLSQFTAPYTILHCMMKTLALCSIHSGLLSIYLTHNSFRLGIGQLKNRRGHLHCEYCCNLLRQPGQKEQWYIARLDLGLNAHLKNYLSNGTINVFYAQCRPKLPWYSVVV